MAFEAPPEYWPDPSEWCRRIARSVRQQLQGKLNATIEVTLDASSASTVVSLAKGRLGVDSVILFDPLTANAATALYGGSMYVAEGDRDVENAQFTITHASTADTDKTFRVLILG